MAKIVKTIIYKQDIIKLCMKANITLFDLAQEAKVNYQFLLRVAHDQQTMSDKKYQSVNSSFTLSRDTVKKGFPLK